MPNHEFPQKLLNFGFGLALFMAVVLMIGSSIYLFNFQIESNQSIERLMDSSIEPKNRINIASIRLVMAGLVFNSCGLFIGISFAFLGFALFLIGVRGELDASATTEKYSVKLLRTCSRSNIRSII